MTPQLTLYFVEMRPSTVQVEPTEQNMLAGHMEEPAVDSGKLWVCGVVLLLTLLRKKPAAAPGFTKSAMDDNMSKVILRQMNLHGPNSVRPCMLAT